jgi:hypothetical protein
MARSSSGRSVARAGATGGGRTYRGQAPVNWYIALVVIVVVGLGSIFYARYEYQHPASASTIEPQIGTTWFAGFVFDICGKQQPQPAENTKSAQTVGLVTSGQGVIVIAPVTAAQAGNNATLGRFVGGYPGMVLTSSTIRSPGGKLYTSGDTCPAGTPDAGKAGQVQVRYWPTFETKTATAAPPNPGDLKLGQNSLVTMAFVPNGAKIAKPPATTVDAVLQDASKVNSTTTTAPSTSTTAPASTTTQAPATTTTAKP